MILLVYNSVILDILVDAIYVKISFEKKVARNFAQEWTFVLTDICPWIMVYMYSIVTENNIPHMQIWH